MDLSIITSLPQLAPYAAYIAAVLGVSAIIAKFLPPPAANATGFYPAIYALINFLGQNSGHATNAVTIAKDITPHV